MENLNTYLEILWNSVNFEFAIKFLIVYVFIVWISIVVWVLKDIRNRTSNLFFQLFCLILPVLWTPLLWFFLYLLVRPSKTLYERYYDEIEENLDIINEIIEERKKQFEKKVNKSIVEEKKKVSSVWKKVNYIYKTNVFWITEKKDLLDKKQKNDDSNKERKEIRVTQIKKKTF